MADRYELKTPRTGSDGKTYWTKIGVMFPMEEKDGFTLNFDALPTPSIDDRGQLVTKVTAFEPFKDDGISAHNKAKADGYQPEPQAKMEPLDDEVPF